jgi:hypothetical protein
VARTQARWGGAARSRSGWRSPGLGAARLGGRRHFWLLCAATVIAGYYNANGQLYRFAAAELVAPAWREKAVSLVLAGGLLGAVAGPNLAAARAPAAHAIRRRLPGAGAGGAAGHGCMAGVH